MATASIRRSTGSGSVRSPLLELHQPGYYPYYGSNYWVPRASMRYRYRYLYYTPVSLITRRGDILAMAMQLGGHRWGW